MAKTLGCPDDRQSILNRLENLRADSRRQWGRMTVDQMICHLNDSFRCALGEKSASPASGFLQRTVIKWAALYAPMRWPQGFPTRPELEQGVGGTPPAEFERDRAELAAMVKRFSDSMTLPCKTQHPVFGRMSEAEWLRWGYLHSDHHLRQFGV